MTDLFIHDLPPGFEIWCSPSLQQPLAPQFEQEIEDLWRAAQMRRETPLHNGALFSIAARKLDRIDGYFTQYKFFYAQMQRPELFETLRIAPLGVSGVLLCPDGIVLGKRGAGSTQDALRWELVPSGGIDRESLTNHRIDPLRQLLTELREEIGLEAHEVREISPLCLIEDRRSRVTDFAALLETPLSGDAIRARHAVNANREYTTIKIVPARNALDILTREDTAETCAVSLALLRHVSARLGRVVN